MSHHDLEVQASLTALIADPKFPEVDAALRAGRHINPEEVVYHTLIVNYFEILANFYHRYHVDLVQAPEGFFYLRPTSSLSLLGKATFSALDMLVGKVLCYLYLSPGKITQQGIFTEEELFSELLRLTDPIALMKSLNQRATGSEADHKKLAEKVHSSLYRLRKAGMITFLPQSVETARADASLKFHILTAILRFSIDVREATTEADLIQKSLFQTAEGVPLQ